VDPILDLTTPETYQHTLSPQAKNQGERGEMSSATRRFPFALLLLAFPVACGEEPEEPKIVRPVRAMQVADSDAFQEQ
jgi:hypothetical protein